MATRYRKTDEFIVVNGWEKFQHYGDRNPTWIKLYTDLLSRYEFTSMRMESKTLLFHLWLLAVFTKNCTPFDAKWIKNHAHLSGKLTFDELIDNGFIRIYKKERASTTFKDVLAHVSSTRAHEGAGESKRREEEEKDPPTPRKRGKARAVQIPKNLDTQKFRDAWRRWLDYMAEIGKPLSSQTQQLQLDELAAWGDSDAIGGIELSIRRGWKKICRGERGNDGAGNNSHGGDMGNKGNIGNGQFGQNKGIIEPSEFNKQETEEESIDEARKKIISFLTSACNMTLAEAEAQADRQIKELEEEAEFELDV